MTSDDELTIIQFLKQGTLGQLRLDMHLDEVLRYLGVPDGQDQHTFNEQQLRKLSGPGVSISGLRYGCIELIIEREHDTVISIEMNFADDVDRKVLAFWGDTWLGFLESMTSNTFKEFLYLHQIDWYQEYRDMPEALFLRIVPSCVQVIFDLEDGNDKLYSLIKTSFTSNCLPEQTHPK